MPWVWTPIGADEPPPPRRRGGLGPQAAAFPRRLARRLVDLALPPACVVCHAPVADFGALCAGCWSSLRFIERPFCERLGTPFAFDIGPGALSAEAIADPPPYDRARAAVIYNDGAKRLVHALKYRDRLEMAETMARMMTRAGRDLLADADLLVPVPLHRVRLWSRRFNQSALLAARIGGAARVAVDPFALVRTRATARQVGLDAAARAKNVAGAFRVPDAALAAVAGRRIVLVDDVLTSGATVAAAVKALKKAKPARIDVLVFARVVNRTNEPI